MKILGKLIFVFVLLVFLGCSKKEDNTSIIQDCSRIKDVKILSEGEGCCAVIGAAVYIYENELYTVQGFCACDEFLISTKNKPVNCDGLELCDHEEGFDDIQKCLMELKFYENAEYLFNISFE